MRLLHLLCVLIAVLSGSAWANPESAMDKAACMACHAKDKRLVGPSFQEIAARYDGQDVVAQLMKKVRSGTSGSFGSIPMPSVDHRMIDDVNLKAVIEFILGRYTAPAHVTRQVAQATTTPSVVDGKNSSEPRAGAGSATAAGQKALVFPGFEASANMCVKIYPELETMPGGSAWVLVSENTCEHPVLLFAFSCFELRSDRDKNFLGKRQVTAGTVLRTKVHMTFNPGYFAGTIIEARSKRDVLNRPLTPQMSCPDCAPGAAKVLFGALGARYIVKSGGGYIGTPETALIQKRFQSMRQLIRESHGFDPIGYTFTRHIDANPPIKQCTDFDFEGLWSAVQRG